MKNIILNDLGCRDCIPTVYHTVICIIIWWSSYIEGVVFNCCWTKLLLHHNGIIASPIDCVTGNYDFGVVPLAVEAIIALWTIIRTGNHIVWDRNSRGINTNSCASHHHSRTIIHFRLHNEIKAINGDIPWWILNNDCAIVRYCAWSNEGIRSSCTLKC